MSDHLVPPRLTPGRLVYLCVHRPAGALASVFKNGGPWVQWRTARGERDMIIAAATLPALVFSQQEPACELHLLTGRRYWHQTAFCLWSFSKAARRRLAPVIYDDGTLTDEHRGHLERLFPATTFVSHLEAAAKLDRWLSREKFPRLRDRWCHYPHIRKIISPHLGSTGPKLVLDSDLLFFRKPTFLLDWLANPDRALHAVDTETAYGYPMNEMSDLAGAPVDPLVNVGLTGLRSEEIDWERLEYWTTSLMDRHGPQYLLEQALVAMMVAGRSPRIAPADDYVTLPTAPESLGCRAVMHHYVAGSKRWYFQHNWRRLVNTR